MLGIWRISWGGSARCTGAGGAGLARFSLGDPLQEGPCGSGRESDPLPEVWLHRSSELGVCAERATSLAGTGSLWDFGWGMGGGDALSSAFFPTKLSSVVWGLSSSPSLCLPAFLLSRAELLTYDLPDAKSCLLLEHAPLGPSAFASQTRGSAWPWAAPPPQLPPASPCSAHCLSALPTFFHGPLVCAWL